MLLHLVRIRNEPVIDASELVVLGSKTRDAAFKIVNVHFFAHSRKLGRLSVFDESPLPFELAFFVGSQSSVLFDLFFVFIKTLARQRKELFAG